MLSVTAFSLKQKSQDGFFGSAENDLEAYPFQVVEQNRNRHGIGCPLNLLGHFRMWPRIEIAMVFGVRTLLGLPKQF